MRFRFLSVFVLCLLALSACSTNSPVRSGTAKSVTTFSGGIMPPPDTTSTGGVYTGVSEYRVGPQDVIEIGVFQVPELNRTVRVNTMGQISLPLIGTMQAGGLTIRELEVAIATGLEAKYLQNPQVTLFVKEYASQRITMEGAVMKPGIYPLTGRTTLLQCIAQAGLTPLADLKGVVIFRQIGGKKMGAVFDIKAIRAGNAEDPLVYGDDVIVVDQNGAKTALSNFIRAASSFAVFGIY